MSTTDLGARTPSTAAMTQGRRDDSARRRRRVLTALGAAVSHGEPVSVSGIARAAGVDRTFLYRHRELLEQIHAAAAQPPAAVGGGPAVSRASLQHRCARMATRAHQLEARLTELLGEHAWRESGLGAPDDIDQLKQQTAALEQHVIDLRLQLQERDQDLAAARAANRELMARVNTANPNR